MASQQKECTGMVLKGRGVVTQRARCDTQMGCVVIDVVTQGHGGGGSYDTYTHFFINGI